MVLEVNLVQTWARCKFFLWFVFWLFSTLTPVRFGFIRLSILKSCVELKELQKLAEEISGKN